MDDRGVRRPYAGGTHVASGFLDPEPPRITVSLEAGARDRVFTLPGTG